VSFDSLTQNAIVAREAGLAGIPVFPCHSQGNRAKSPALSKDDGGNGFHDATTDPQKITAMWSRFPDAMAGTPPPAACVIVDTDCKTDDETGEVLHGDETLAAKGLLGLADTSALIVKTPSGGVHRYFSVEDVDSFSNTSNVNGLALVDLRCAGKGYVIAPGCEYHAGRYDAIKGALGDTLTPMPEELVAALRKPDPTPATLAGQAVQSGKYVGPEWAVDAGQNRLSPRGRVILEKRFDGLFRSIVRSVERAQAGDRHRPLLAAARTLGGYLHYRAFSREEVEVALFNASIENGHVQKDGAGMSRAAIAAGLDDGIAHPLALENRGVADAAR